MMDALRVGRPVIGALVAVGMLAGCGGGGTTSVPPAVTQNVAHHATSSSGDLLYVDDGGSNCCAYFLVYTYPQGKLVANIGGFTALRGECSDADGNVFIVAPTGVSSNSTATTVYEYAHGGTTPIATLNEGGEGVGCAVDPTTGNLAVANNEDDSNPYGQHWGSVAIFQQASGTPLMYYSSTAQYFYYCGYDNKANLYLSAQIYKGYALDSLDAGSSSITEVRLKKPLYGAVNFGPSVQWDGKEMTVSSTRKNISIGEETGPVNVYRLNIASNKATIIGTTTLKAPQDRQRGQTWIQGRTIIGITYWHGRPKFSFWRFPNGGNPSKQIEYQQYPPGSVMFGLTVSVAPTT